MRNCDRCKYISGDSGCSTVTITNTCRYMPNMCETFYLCVRCHSEMVDKINNMLESSFFIKNEVRK